MLATAARAGFRERRGSSRVVRARADFARAVWTAQGERRLPGEGELDRALSALPREELDFLCELAPLGPLYFLPTRRFVNALARTIAELGSRRVVEVAAGDGFLSRSLAPALEARGVEITATDSGAWQRATARMNARERAALREVDVPGVMLGPEVRRMTARRALRELAPDLVLCAWLPPSARMLDALIRAEVRYVLEIGAGSGVTGSAYAWRFHHDFLEGELAGAARCRLDVRPARALHSRITLYYGAKHPEFFEERVEPGDYLDQYKPTRARRA